MLVRGFSTGKCILEQFLRCCCNTRFISQEHKFVPRRAVLYVPGNDERKLKKIEGLDVDCVVMDCEDGVALNRKAIISLCCPSKGRVWLC